MFECVPNISEGRNTETIALARQAISSADGVRLLHEDVGYDANRTVFTFIGSESAIYEACLNLYKTALKRIDLRTHSGEHPRLGAVDVCPIVPVSGTSFAAAKALVRRLGETVGNELGIPVFLYEKSQEKAHRQRLSDIRRGQFEGLREKLALEDWIPDFGPAAPHESFGATVIGARDFLIAFNVSLGTTDPTVAKEIAKTLRGYRQSTDAHTASVWQAVRAIGWEMPKYRCTQVSTNIVNMDLASLAEVYLEVQRLAKGRGVDVLGSELIGLVPRKALVRAGAVLGAAAGEEIVTAISKLNLSFHSEFETSRRLLDE